MTVPLIMMFVGFSLIVYRLTAGRRPADPAARTVARARLRFAWDLLAGAWSLGIFSAYMLAPRHVMPGQRIPRPKARRMVRPIHASEARKLIR